MRLFAVLLATVFALSAAAQSDETTLRDRLLHKPLYLRCLCAQDKLSFDATGKPSGRFDPISFTLSGVEITSLDLHSNSLALKGRRIGLQFDRQGTPKRVPVQVMTTFSSHDEEVRILIAAPAGKDYSQALDAVFTDQLEDLAASLPPIWRSYAARHLHGPPLAKEPPAEQKATPDSEQPPHTPGTRKVGGGVTAPIVRFMPEPQFSQQARATKVAGAVLVYLHVDKDGTPSHILVLRPLGMGLDERAAEAVSRYKFTPAMQNGEPVVVEMNVEVNFQIF